MKHHNFNSKIPLYVKTNPKLTPQQIGTLLLIDNIYLEKLEDLKDFRTKYPHFDPKLVEKKHHEGITFLELCNKRYSKRKIKEKLNNYLNIKFNHIGDKKPYEINMVKFKYYSLMTSNILNNLLKRAKFPKEMIDVLKEPLELKNCVDVYEMFVLYNKTDSEKIKFAILRRLGLIIIISQIEKSFPLKEIDFALNEIGNAFLSNLLKEKGPPETYYYWADHQYNLNYCKEKNKAEKNYIISTLKRQKLASQIYPLQVFKSLQIFTKQNNLILHFEIRNKFKKKGEINYTSAVEKIIRKNLEFPNQIHDVIGLKLVVKESSQISKLIKELESFLGGSSTRKREKNAFNKFGKRKLTKHSSGEYSVWKAIYDIALPHPTISKIREAIGLIENENGAKEFLLEIIKDYMENPRYFIAEVQVQDLKSYLLSNTKGSIPHHSMLKLAQIKENTFHKLFPVEIYKKTLWELKERILNS
jgi:hypothetical protein